ncbi:MULTISPECIES: CGNR zinc finger domain-containing protein [unclassified Microbacterium]|uniref:CGNR zinc finger domain-containing protein n=1 Tax=unclassified Microbacterium TaxID=2609290 RepID=UPI00214CE17F|nr:MULTISPECIES: CGNR zinc finger domain-containing protein [unclassified Microbacterium]MCR2800574.1 CGNR zinc finger domain-containing protein [Microbacterium sp. zg.Y818]MCR2824687.1 CGNR zinc finger domain-containing protein [Microbacterium sp. zg.Y909]WIM23303.1 CGNR zinc finger domain-containing protein [Microbacterium sp. zg-Y818]
MAAPKTAEVHPLPLPLLVHIVNEWGDAPRIEAHEGNEPYPTAESLRAQSPQFWAHFPPFDERTLVETANLVHPIFAAPSGSECAERLNGLISEAQMSPALSSEAWTVQEVWHTARPDRALLAGATLSLIDHLRHEPDASRLGVCEGDACADVYVDQSPAGRRQYCSLTCQNRNRTRAYRAHRRAAAQS